jgi:hypothetical protein
MALQLSPAELDLVRQWFNSLEDTNPKFLDAADRALMAKIRPAIQSDNLAKAQADGPKREWPHDAPRIDTRDCGFNLYDRDRIHLSPDAVIAAIKDTNEKFGEAPTYRRPR